MSNINNLTVYLKEHLRLHKSRAECLSQLIFGLFKSESVNFRKLSNRFSGRVKPSSNFRRIQRFFAEVAFNYTDIPLFIMDIIGDLEGPFIVTVDRTNWKFGSTDINILVIGVVYGKFTIPIVWELLDKKGNSNTFERKELMDRFLALIPAWKIEVFLADREFIGEGWFLYLQEKSVPYAIRIKGNLIMRLEDGATITTLKYFGKTGSYRTKRIKNVVIFGVKTNVAAVKRGKEPQIIAYSEGLKRSPVKLYQQRWSIETLFLAIKSKGFDVEDTRLNDLEKLKKLFAVVVMAFAFAIKMGVLVAEKIPIKIKNHSRPEFSIFSYGKNTIIHMIENNLIIQCIIPNKNKIVVY